MLSTQPDHPGHAVIELSGELGITAASALAAALSAALASTPEIDVDLTPRHPIGPSLPFWVIRWLLY